MTITVHEAECYVGYTKVYYRDTNKARIIANIAAVCRGDWQTPHAGGWEAYWVDHKQTPDMGDQAPPIPDTDEEVVSTYFWADPSEHPEERWISWDEFEINLAAPQATAIDLTVDGAFSVERQAPKLTATRYGSGGASLDGTLLDGSGAIGEALEGFLLALTAAGAPVHLPEFKEALRGYCADTLADKLSLLPESVLEASFHPEWGGE